MTSSTTSVVGVGDGLGDGEGLGDGDGLGEGEGLGDGLGEGDELGDGEGLGDGDGLGSGPFIMKTPPAANAITATRTIPMRILLSNFIHAKIDNGTNLI